MAKETQCSQLRTREQQTGQWLLGLALSGDSVEGTGDPSSYLVRGVLLLERAVTREKGAVPMAGLCGHPGYYLGERDSRVACGGSLTPATVSESLSGILRLAFLHL